ncbi:MAG: hypothetical protein WKG32_06515 [Gemmatimonadaceae bacterium]
MLITSTRVRATSALLLLGATACSFGRPIVREQAPAHTPPQSTSIMGDWILSTSPDSTAFVGARLVELQLTPGNFTITAHYGGQPALVVTGMAVGEPEGGLLTLRPQTNSRATRGERDVVLAPGQTISVIATAADNTMLFAPAQADAAVQPTSVWHRRDAARAAGARVDGRSTRPDSARRP